VFPKFGSFRKKRPEDYYPMDEARFRELRRKHVIRLFVTYLAPFMILTIYLYTQYRAMDEESRRLHLRAIAESQANTLDLFLSERLINLSNIIDDPRMPVPATEEFLRDAISKLQKASAAFVDLGCFDASGKLVAYVGPFPSLTKKSYASENWFAKLKVGRSNFVITDIYLGFRGIPHFTIGVSRIVNGRFIALRATLTPEKMYDFISSFEGAKQVHISTVNIEGFYQLVPPRLGTPLKPSSFIPPKKPRLGVSRINPKTGSDNYVYSWLNKVNWALIVQEARSGDDDFFSDLRSRMVIAATIVFIIFIGIIFVRAGKAVESTIKFERNRLQLGQAAKLASIGELAAGIAHEINNPLAAIGAEAGLVKDMMNPKYGGSMTPEEIVSHMDSIQEMVLRSRDITQKLLKFVRKTDVKLDVENVHELIEEVLNNILGHEIEISKVHVERNYECKAPEILTDGHQLQQVVLNIVKNAMDAIGEAPGNITINTRCDNNNLEITISDTGKGMNPEQLDKVFMPFFTTKEVGSGTGLGLSVSYGIVKALKGDVNVKSEAGRGTTFTITLPFRVQSVFPTRASA
jgi:two-component system NtrC family sensor kinase